MDANHGTSKRPREERCTSLEDQTSLVTDGPYDFGSESRHFSPDDVSKRRRQHNVPLGRHSHTITSPKSAVPHYLRLKQTPFSHEVISKGLDDNLRAANLMLHRRVRRRRESKLCFFCAKLDLLGAGQWQLDDDDEPTSQENYIRWNAFEINPEINEDVQYLMPIALGHISVVVFDTNTEQACPLCEVMRKAVPDILGTEGSETTVTLEAVPRTLRIATSFYQEEDGDAISLSVSTEDASLHTTIAVFPKQRDITQHVIEQRPGLRHATHFHTLSTRNSKHPHILTWAREIPNPKVDWALITKWLDASSVPSSSSDAKSLSGFRLIDVRAERIVEQPMSSCYAALSYVWGNCRQYRLLRNRVKTLEHEGSLRSVAPRLSTVVKDAMKTCFELDIPYLWVDSLCIIHDDAESKHAQILGMDLIYSAAHITIVDGNGTDANSGLSRVSAPSKRICHHAVIDGCTYVVAEDPWHAFERSKWTTRGWIFQELVLSRRLLVFTETTAIVCTSKGANAESMHFLHYDTWIPSDDAGQIVMFCDFINRSYKSLPYTSIKDVLHAYNSSHMLLIDEFLARDLSRDHDVEDAFAGILNAEEATLGKCRHGLPVQILARALLWNSDVKALSSGKAQQESYYTRRRPGFPSWSWMGWEFSDYLQEAASRTDIFCPFIHIYGLHESGELVRLLGDRTFSDEGYDTNALRQLNLIRWANFYQFQPLEEEPERSALPKLSLPLSQYLIFWASCARFPVSFSPAYQNEDGAGLYLIDTTSQIKDVDAVSYFVHLSIDWRAQQPDELEFIAIAGGDRGELYTLLIERRDGIGYRIAMPSEPLDVRDWINRNPERKLIVLG